MRLSTKIYQVIVAAVTVLLGSVRAANTSSPNSPEGQAGQIHFRGRVVDAQGAPIEGARVRFYEQINAGTVYSRDSRLAGDVTTGNDGTFSFSAPAKGEGYRYADIVAEHGKSAIGLANWRMADDQETEIKLGEAREIAGIVVDQDDKPVSEARVSVLMLQIGDGEQRRSLGSPVSEELLSVITDDKGRFNMGRIPAGATAEFLIAKDGRATIGTFQRSIYTGKGYQYLAGRKDIRLTLPFESRIEGAVVEKQTGRPVANAQVMITDTTNRPLPGLESVLSGENGTFSIDALPPGDHLVKYVLPADGLVEWVSVPVGVALRPGETKSDVKIELSKGGILEVLVSASGTGKPVEGARVSVYEQRHRQWYRGQSNSEGVGRIRVPPGTYQSASAHKEGFSSFRFREPVNLRTQSYEEILRSNDKAIAGVAVDESGSPVAGVPVGVRCHKRLRDNGKFSWMFSSFMDLKATTDEQGRFAIDIKEDGEYNLLFSPDNHAAMIVYDVPVGKKDLKVTLPAGGTVAGRLVRMDKGKKVPIPNAEIKIEQPDRASYTHLGFDRDRTTTTDSEGRFRFEHLRTRIRPHGSMSKEQWNHIPRVWQISYGEISKNIEFTSETKIEDFEIIVEPDLPQTVVGSAFPGFDGIKIDLAADFAKDKMLMVCFFDLQQRPSRAYLMQLNTKVQELKAKNVAIVAVQAARMDEDRLNEWYKKYDISFPVGMIQGDEKIIRSTWSVKSLPWLILADHQHIVRAEGFSIGELNEKVKPTEQ